MGHLAERLGLLEPLRAFVADGGPVMGTCAGLIFLANTVDGQKKGGQRLVGGMDLTVRRNFFGSQVDSFQTELDTEIAPGRKVPAVFIRAPAILATGPRVQVLASVPLDPEQDGAAPKTAPVAVQDGNLLGICFHPGQPRGPPIPRLSPPRLSGTRHLRSACSRPPPPPEPMLTPARALLGRLASRIEQRQRLARALRLTGHREARHHWHQEAQGGHLARPSASHDEQAECPSLTCAFRQVRDCVRV